MGMEKLEDVFTLDATLDFTQEPWQLDQNNTVVPMSLVIVSDLLVPPSRWRKGGSGDPHLQLFLSAPYHLPQVI